MNKSNYRQLLNENDSLCISTFTLGIGVRFSVRQLAPSTKWSPAKPGFEAISGKYVTRLSHHGNNMNNSFVINYV